MGRNAGTYVLQEYHTQENIYERVSYTAGETWGGWNRYAKYHDLFESVKIINFDFDDKSIDANNLGSVTKDITGLIPSGYKVLFPICTYTGSMWWYFVNIYEDSNNVVLLIRNTYGNTDTGKPCGAIICIKDS